MGAFPQIGEILLVTFYTVMFCFYFFSILCPGRTARPIFKLSGSKERPTCFAQGGTFSGSRGYVTSFGENMPTNLLNLGVNRQFQAKMPKYKNRNISETTNRIKSKCEDITTPKTINYTSLVVCIHHRQIQHDGRPSS